jgi:hypothetical protein
MLGMGLSVGNRRVRMSCLRTFVVGLAALLVACQSAPPASSPETESSRESQQPPSSSVLASGAPTGSPQPAGPAPLVGRPDATPAPRPLPPDVVALVDAIVDAPTEDAAVAATRTVLELSGVLIVDDIAARRGSPAGMYISTVELRSIALEARRRTRLSRLTLGDFARSVAVLADIPASNAATASPSQPDAVQFKVVDQPMRFANFMRAWVLSAEKYRASADPKEAALTHAPLFVAALARRQAHPVDLRSPFAPDALRLGALDLVLITAGLRATLLAASANATSTPGGTPAPQAPKPSTPPGVSPSPQGRFGHEPDPAAFRGPGRPFAAVAVAGLACDQMVEYLQTSAPLTSELSQFAFGEGIKGLVGEVVGELKDFSRLGAQGLGAILEVVGILFRLQALLQVLSNVEVETELSVDTVHKAHDQTTSVTATVTAGIPSDAWAEFKKGQQQTPLAEAARGCASYLGLPWVTDLGDVAQLMKNWHARWEIYEGLGHAEFPIGQFFGPGSIPGRFERTLKPDSDHTATDTITVNITPEKEKDHPGKEVEAWVVICSYVRTDEAPGLKTMLNLGVSGTGLGDLPIVRPSAERIAAVSGKLNPAVFASLLATFVDLLASYIQNLATFDSCDRMKVTYHVPKQGSWSGTITMRSQFSSKADYGRSGVQKFLARGGGTLTFANEDQTTTGTTIRTGDELHVTGKFEGGLPPDQATPIEFLTARQLSYGFNEHWEQTERKGVESTDCIFSSTKVSSYSGSYSYESHGRSVDISFSADGSYKIVFDLDRAPAASLEMKGLEWGVFDSTQAVRWRPPGSEFEVRAAPGCARQIPTREGTRPMNIGGPAGAVLHGRLDPRNPGDHLTGTLEIPGDDGTKTVITWDLRHEGPIRLPPP